MRMSGPSVVNSASVVEQEPMPIQFTPLFEATWGYEEFTRVAPFGPNSEAQAFAFTAREGCRIEGERLSGSYRLVQFPRWRSDGLFLPDAHGLLETKDGRQVMIQAGGFAIPVPDAQGEWAISHWMRFWTAAPEFAWLNQTVAFGVGSLVENVARVRYFGADPAAKPVPTPAGAPSVELLGTARWEYPEYEAVRLFGDREGVGFASSVGEVKDGPLAGTWRGWHYPTYLRTGLYQLDAHVEITTPEGIVVNRHAGLATKPSDMAPEIIYHATQHAVFITEVPALAKLNRTLALGVGVVRDPGIVTLSYYGLSPAR
jgi:hypothetical protein